MERSYFLNEIIDYTRDDLVEVSLAATSPGRGDLPEEVSEAGEAAVLQPGPHSHPGPGAV